jgi:hypothetical protein
MRRIAVALIVGLGLGLLAAPAAAKELHSAKICGKSKCTVVRDKDDIRGFAFTALGADEPPSGPFFTVELSVRAGADEVDSWTLDYMPDPGLIRVPDEFGDDAWWALGTGAAQRLRALTADVEPFPASAFAAAMDESPGTFTTADLAALRNPPAAEQLTSSPRPDSSGATWLIPVLTFAGIALVALVGLRVQHRRTTAAG